MFESLKGKIAEIPQAQQLSLDRLWRAAEHLGRVGVDHVSLDGDYRVEIVFESKSGSRIYAKASHRIIEFALQRAIEEALRLGAKP